MNVLAAFYHLGKDTRRMSRGKELKIRNEISVGHNRLEKYWKRSVTPGSSLRTPEQVSVWAEIAVGLALGCRIGS